MYDADSVSYTHLISKTMTRMENKAVDTIVRGIFNQMKKWF